MKIIFFILLFVNVVLSAGSDKKSITSMGSFEHELFSEKIEFIEVSDCDVRIVSFFKNSTVTTFFRKSRFKNNVFLTLIPIKQEFYYHPTQEIFISKDYEARLWEDGPSGYSFRYKDCSKKIPYIYVTLNDMCEKFQCRYTLQLLPSNN